MSRWPGRLISKNEVIPDGAAPTAKAPGIWTLPEVAYWNKQGRWPSANADPYWSYVSFLLGTTATNGAQNNTFLDSSTNNFTITRAGNTTQGTFAPYGSLWSNYFDGSGDYLTSSGGTATAVGTGDFSVEAFVFWTSYPTQYTSIFSTRSTNNANAAAFTVGVESSGYVYAFSSAFIAQTSSGVFALNTWNHVVFTRSGTTARLFVNGVLRATGTNSQNFSDQGFAVGANRDGTEQCAGYVSNVRMVKGSIPADYQTSSTTTGTTIFTPPAAPLTAISGTSLLTCQSNRFIDNSSNNFTITRNGDTRVTNFSPFVLAPPGYNTTDNGGSGYFDGSGDYLSVPNNAAFSYGTGDFTMEAWVYKAATGSMAVVDSFTSGGSGTFGFSIQDTTISGYQTNVLAYTFTYSLSLNAWQHIAFVRSGTTLTCYVNGVSIGSQSNSANFTSSNSIIIGRNAGSGGEQWAGHISNLRIVKGTAVYTGTFTPPTTPLTAITNTSLLLNFTNAGIFDAAMKSDMETVGNAQVSTAAAKYGTTSAAFDGNGDYLVAPSNSVFDLGAGNFTIECWFNANSFASPFGLVSRYAYSGSGSGWLLQVRSATSIRFLVGNDVYFDSTVSTMSTGTWYHVAAVRNGTTNTLYLNGTQVGQATGVAAFADATTTTLQVGRTHTISDDFNGYMDDLRITKGYARYTSNFTPPSAPLPVY